ncbi:hypothetical protein [Vulcanisaeta distributa]|uniref:Uncharacterized protein n=1 Tax=Vulcanisaeta distributa (strain DSM 14429 / JCM 11212 / NBRC 100878 / IC-017) TaxID=572478 RepID=E1QPT7_VULDI|nr:hypothetical protein [Vulcanisaeta distributa]ADN51497.1 hypothetical protein Vdis_2128 [Vulcanisaeta distributa DSM 14429]
MAIEVPSNLRLYGDRCTQAGNASLTNQIIDEGTRKEAIEVLTEALLRLEKWKIQGMEWLSEYVKSAEDSG